MQNFYEKYAHLLLKYSLDLKKKQRLFIQSTYLAEPLLQSVYKLALSIGAHVEYKLDFNDSEYIFMNYTLEDQLSQESLLLKYIVQNFDADLLIRAPFNRKGLSGISAIRKQKASLSIKEIRNIKSQRVSEGKLKRCICEFPTPAGAQEAGMSLEEYEKFIFSACFLYENDPIVAWQNIHEKQQKWVDFFNNTNEVQYLGNNFDLSFSVKGQKWRNSSGRQNMPSGEIFTSPLAGSVNGTFCSSFPAIYMDEEISDIYLKFENGSVVEAKAEKGDKLLKEILKIDGADKLGEVAIGLNYGINHFMKNILFDEKTGGTVHIALGNGFPETGTYNTSAIHWDLLGNMSKGRIYADGKLVYKNGCFIDL